MNTLKRFRIPITVAAVIVLVSLALAARTLGGDQDGAPGSIDQDASLVVKDQVGDATDRVAARPVAYQADQQLAGIVTINVSVDDNGVTDDTIFVPQGQSVKLVFRNRSSDQHHFHIVGMPTSEMLWMATGDHADHEGHQGHEGHDEQADMPEDEHAQHHSSVAFVDHHVCNSEFGICPVGDWVHAHANPGQLDVIIFTADEAGTYQVECPVHEEISARVVVY